MQKVHSYGWAEPILQRIDQFSTNLLTQNLNTLEKYLSQSEPIVQYSGEKDKLIFLIQPQSMSAITFSELLISGLNDFEGSTKPVKSVIKMIDPDGISKIMSEKSAHVATNDNGLDLSFNPRLEMYTGLDRNSNRVPRKYIISFDIKNIDFSDLSLEKIKITFRNKIMDSELPNSSVSLSKISQTDFEELISSVSFYDNRMKFPLQ